MHTIEENKRKSKLLERRSGEDRRRIYSLKYFADGGKERRAGLERRAASERRAECFRVSKWSSVCPDKDDIDNEA